MSIRHIRGHWTRRGAARLTAVSLLFGGASALVPLMLSPVPVAASGDPVGIGFTYQGCRGNETLLPPGGPYVCPDADYTSGYLGNQWKELDLVPVRLFATAGAHAPASQTYQVAITAAAASKQSTPGFDYISLPVLNTALSSASCTAVSATPSTGAGATISPGVNNAGTSLYRVLTISQLKGATCVYDWYQRLGLGSHAYSGASLHSDLAAPTFSNGVVTDLDSIPGVRTLSIDDGVSTAPGLSESLSATRGASYSWTISNQAQPTSLPLPDTCTADGRSAATSLTVSWHRTQVDASQTVVVVQLFADNALGRALNVDIVDTLYDAGHAAVGNHDTGSLTVPANSSHYLVATVTYTVSGTSASYTDDATATYSDPATHMSAGSAVASATSGVQVIPPTSNATAVVTDTLSIAGAGLRYAVDSVSLAGRSFGTYVLGTVTTAPAVWTSPTLSGDGSAAFHVTVSVSAPVTTTGSLSSTATLQNSSAGSATAPMTVGVTTAGDCGTKPTPTPTPEGSPTPTPTPTSGTSSSTPTPNPTSTPTPSPTSTPSSGSQGSSVVSPSATPSPAGNQPSTTLLTASSAPQQGAAPVVSLPVTTPFTGADLPYGEAGLLVLIGGGLLTVGVRRSRRVR